MAQNTIRIECNPYTKEVKYYWKNDGGSELWSDLSENKSSPFAKSKSGYKGFAEATIAHKAYEILSVINSQYNKGKNGIEIIVDGTKEDLDELEAVIKSSFPDSGMFCIPGEMYMLSAKEVMPQIEDIYSALGKILSDHSDDEIGELIARYSETVKPEIALCVMGLYSSGKSSFINSLIGKEVLPSASDPATAKIYKINCDESVWVNFNFENVSYRIDFLDNEWRINTSPDARMISNLIDSISRENEKEKQLFVALTVLNEFAILEGKARQSQIEKLAEGEGITLSEYLEKNSVNSLIEKKLISEYQLSDLIEIGIPFNPKTELPIKDYKFVIFDTPGSNSAMHKEHIEILRKSLENRTDGLPIFVTNPDTLDSTDNIPVIKMIEMMGNALDKSSTMIIVNKADEKSESELMEKREKRGDLKVTSWKSSRIYFISSVVSLGNKLPNPSDEKSWINPAYGSCYRKYFKNFNGCDDLLQLYRYNILPENIQCEFVSTANNIALSDAIKRLKSVRESFIKFFENYKLEKQAKELIDDFIIEIDEKIKSNNDKTDIESKKENIIDVQKQIENKIEEIFSDLKQNIASKCETEADEDKTDDFERFEEFEEEDDALQKYKKKMLKYVKMGMNSHLIACNSGIEIIEHEIGTFGERFALYNKCVQAEKYLEEAIERLKEKIASTTDEIKSTQSQIEREITDAIRELEKELQEKCDTEKSKLDTGFASDVVGPYVKLFLNLDRVKGLINRAIAEANGDSSKWKESGIFKGAKNSTEYVKYVKRIISRKFDDDVKEYAKDVNDTSDGFWEKGIQSLKEILLTVVYDSKKLTNEQKKIAKDVVMQAGKMSSSHSDLNLGVGAGTVKKQFLWVKWDEFDSEEAGRKYKSSLKDVIEGKNKSIALENTQAFDKWKSNLIAVLRSKLSQLNPKVVELNKKLVHCQELDEDLNEQLKKVEKARFDISQLLVFKEVE